MKKIILMSALLSTGLFQLKAQEEDAYLWLEEVDGKKAIEWVEQQNKKTIDKLSQEKDYKNIYNKTLEIINSTERIASPTIYANYIYNFWQDKEHVRGIWRRTTKESYLSGNPSWELLLDVDALSKQDNVKWVYKGRPACILNTINSF